MFSQMSVHFLIPFNDFVFSLLSLLSFKCVIKDLSIEKIVIFSYKVKNSVYEHMNANLIIHQSNLIDMTIAKLYSRKCDKMAELIEKARIWAKKEHLVSCSNDIFYP